MLACHNTDRFRRDACGRISHLAHCCTLSYNGYLSVFRGARPNLIRRLRLYKVSALIYYAASVISDLRIRSEFDFTLHHLIARYQDRCFYVTNYTVVRLTMTSIPGTVSKTHVPQSLHRNVTQHVIKALILDSMKPLAVLVAVAFAIVS